MARISLDDAILRTLGAAVRLERERVGLRVLAGRVLAEDLDFLADLPPFDHAAMDGYAIAGAASAETSFAVVGESRAGAPATHADGRSAMTISTGAAVPSGLDTVVPWEDVRREEGAITLTRDARAGQHIRRRGEDAKAGARALSAGTRLSARHVALLATLERADAWVASAPRVAVLCTGDELRDPGSPPRPGAIVDSNGPMLSALIAQAGGNASVVRVPDTREALEAALDAALERADLVVTVGGAADGKHDHVMPALASLGATTIFRGVSIKPGKPVALARLTRGERVIPVLALPGNPGSAFVTFTLLGLPLVRAMQGDRRARGETLRVPSAESLRATGDRDVLVYGALERRDGAHVFVPARTATSGSVPGVASAAAIAIVPAGTVVEKDELVEVVDVERA